MLFSALALVGSLTLADRSDWRTLVLYGSMLFTTAIGLDFVFRGRSVWVWWPSRFASGPASTRLACSICVHDASRIAWVPLWLTGGEAVGISIVWLSYLKNYRLPRPRISLRFLSIMVQRGRTVCLIQLSQAVIISADLLVVGFLSSWGDVGLYGAPYRMVTALLTFGLILQQAAFPTLSRLWREQAGAGREALDSLVEVLMTGLVPVAVGCTVLADPLVHLVLPSAYAGAGTLLALGIWRAPLLILAYLYQTTLIALNRESVGVRTLVAGAIGIVPLVALLRLSMGLPGASLAVILIGLGLVLDRVRMPGSRRTSAGLASSPGASGAGLAGDDSGLPGSQALPCAPGRGWVVPSPTSRSGLRSGACVTRNSGSESWGRWLGRARDRIVADASLINRDTEVAHEIRHDHNVLRGAQLRRRRRLRRAAQPGALPAGP